jgi:DNA-binding response OmpR family regulator
VTAKRTTTPPRLLVVDDDARYGQWLGHHLGVFCPDSSLSVLNCAEFDRWCETDSGRDCDIILLTASFGSSPEDPKARGLELLRRLRGRAIFPAVITLAEEGNELTAVRALQLGAVDYLPKRLLTPERLNTSVRLALRRIEKRVQRKLATLTHVTDVAPAEDETTREQPKPVSIAIVEKPAATSATPVSGAPAMAAPAVVAPALAAPALVEIVVELTPADVLDADEFTKTTSDKAIDSLVEDIRASAEQAKRTAEAAEAHAAATHTAANQAALAQSAPAQVDAPATAIVDVNALIAEFTRTDDRVLAKAASAAPVATPTAASAPAAATSVPLSATPAPAKPETSPSTVTADPGTAAATQLMSPGVIAAALDAAAASAMAAGIKATESSVFGTTAVGAVSKSKNGKSGSKKSNIPAPAVTAEFIPGYIIKMKIGESEKAVVYLATSISLGSNVALKVSKTLRDDSAGRQFLEREYTAIIAIRDPLVVQIYDYGVHAGFEYLAMEYLLRGDLKARMQAGLKETEALRYVEQIASALRVVHNAGLLHRDLKPPNVMLRENDEVALIDFGLARALDGSTPSTRTGVLRGSPYYMSPEQAQGEVLDVRSDFYSLGIMFYEMLTGRKPYTGATAMEVLQQHVNSPLPSLPHSLARYEFFLNKLVAKNRTERFNQAEEIIAAIGELQTARPKNVESAVA